MGFKFNPLAFAGFSIDNSGTSMTWVQPVNDEASLPSSAQDGEARIALDTHKLYIWSEDDAKWIDTDITIGDVEALSDPKGLTVEREVDGDILRTTLKLHPADESNPGIISTTAQTFAGNKTFSDDVTVQGNLTVEGLLTSINSQDLEVEDANITINKGGDNTTAQGAGLTVERVGTNGSLIYDSTVPSRFKVGDEGSEIEIVDISSSQILTNKTISYDNSTSGLSATNVQDAIDEVEGRVDVVEVVISDHIADTTDAHDASAISYDNSTSGLTATEVQSAIDELEDEKVTGPTPIPTRYILVDKGRTDTYTPDGTFLKPFKTIQSAIDAAPSGSACEIKINPGEYTEDLTIEGKLNLAIVGQGVLDSHPVKVNGTCTIQGTTTTRVRLEDFQIDGVGTNPCLVINDTQGRLYFGDMALTGDVEFQGNVQRWFEFVRCAIAGELLMSANPAVGSSVRLIENLDFATKPIVDNVNWTLRIEEARRLGHVTHNSGAVFLDGVHRVQGDAGIAITSTADDSNSNNMLWISNVDFQRETTSYSTINKTGNCPWRLDKSNRDVDNDVLTGTRINYSQPSIDIFYDNTTSGLTSENIQDVIDELNVNQADYIPLTQKGAVGGVASLDSNGKVPVAQLPSSIMQYIGTWDASTNTPTLADGGSNPDDSIGDVYRVSVAGTVDLGSGSITFNVGDYVILNASKVWEKSDTTDAVNSVNGQTGIVVLDTDDIDEGSSNLYFTNQRAIDAVGPVQAASDGDISETSFNLSTNQTTPVDVTNFNFNNTDVRSFEGLCSVYISSDDELYETFKILGIQKASGWDMSVEKVGDDSQVIFSITTLGQIQYTTPNYSNFNSGLLKFRAITTSI